MFLGYYTIYHFEITVIKCVFTLSISILKKTLATATLCFSISYKEKNLRKS